MIDLMENQTASEVNKNMKLTIDWVLNLMLVIKSLLGKDIVLAVLEKKHGRILRKFHQNRRALSGD